MSAIEPLKVLLSEIARSLQVLGRIEQYYDQYTQAKSASGRLITGGAAHIFIAVCFFR